jgi:flagellar export protein FliJ
MSMKPFRLEAVLDLRATAKERTEQELGTAIHKCKQASACYMQAEQELISMAGQLCSGRFTVASRQQGWDALCRQRELCAALKAALAEAEKHMLACRVRLVGVSIDHELVIRLKQKWAGAQTRMQARFEELQLEELVSARRNLRLPIP